MIFCVHERSSASLCFNLHWFACLQRLLADHHGWPTLSLPVITMLACPAHVLSLISCPSNDLFKTLLNGCPYGLSLLLLPYTKSQLVKTWAPNKQPSLGHSDAHCTKKGPWPPASPPACLPGRANAQREPPGGLSSDLRLNSHSSCSRCATLLLIEDSGRARSASSICAGGRCISRKLQQALSKT